MVGSMDGWMDGLETPSHHCVALATDQNKQQEAQQRECDRGLVRPHATSSINGVDQTWAIGEARINDAFPNALSPPSASFSVEPVTIIIIIIIVSRAA
jgi:hypothetical protein